MLQVTQKVNDYTIIRISWFLKSKFVILASMNWAENFCTTKSTATLGMS